MTETKMECVTVRRWVALSPAEVWRRLCDVEELVAEDPTLELVVPPFEPDTLRPGDHLVVQHQRGLRQTQLRVEIVEAQAPERFVACVRTRATTWLLEIDVTPLDADRSDLAMRARLDTPGPGRGASTVPRRVSDGIEALLDGLAHHVERAAPARA
jgi:hypothetical protein